MFEFNHIDSTSFHSRLRCIFNGILYLMSRSWCVLDLWTDFLRSCYYIKGLHNWNWKKFFVIKHHLLFIRKCLKIFFRHTFFWWTSCCKLISSLKSNFFIFIIFVPAGYAAYLPKFRITAGAMSINSVDLPCTRHTPPIFSRSLNLSIYRW